MPRTFIVFHREPTGEVPVLDWLRKLRKMNRREYETCVAAVERLAAFGHELRRPVADLLRDGIYELRIRKGHVNYRILYFFHGRDLAILGHATPKRMSYRKSKSKGAFAANAPSNQTRKDTRIRSRIEVHHGKNQRRAEDYGENDWREFDRSTGYCERPNQFGSGADDLRRSNESRDVATRTCGTGWVEAVRDCPPGGRRLPGTLPFHAATDRKCARPTPGATLRKREPTRSAACERSVCVEPTAAESLSGPEPRTGPSRSPDVKHP